jgi:hypothetical protein
MTMTTLYPFATPTDASPIPVLPEVGSIITEPFFKIPCFSASSIIALATLSLTEPPGLKYSNFTNSFAFSESAFSVLTSLSKGVRPIS